MTLELKTFDNDGYRVQGGFEHMAKYYLIEEVDKIINENIELKEKVELLKNQNAVIMERMCMTKPD